LRAQGDGPGVVEDKACQLRAGRRVTFLQQRGPADELALVELDAETEAGLIGIGFGGDVRAPDAIALLEAQRVDSLVSARDKPKLVACLPDRVPQPQPELGRAVQLPTQLADIRDAKRET